MYMKKELLIPDQNIWIKEKEVKKMSTHDVA